MKFLTSIVLGCLMAIFLMSPAMAQDEDGRTGPSVREQVDVEIAMFQEQLGWSEYTWTQVELILKSGIRRRIAIARSYGVNGDGSGLELLDDKQQRKMAKDLSKAREDTEDRVKRYLSKDERKQFKAFQEAEQAEDVAWIEGGTSAS